MKKKVGIFGLILMIVFSVCSMTAFADIGPKPSVEIRFEGMEDLSYYTTLLSSTSSTGPWSAVSTQDYLDWYGTQEAFNRFAEYQDPDGYFFLGCFDDCSETDSFVWNYYPPSSFKVLIWLPESDIYAVTSAVYERYAFDSYYTVTVKAEDLLAQSGGTVGELGSLQKSYAFGWELFSLLCRIVLTIAVELLIALLFGYRSKKQLMVIGSANLITQTILNILLNVINYRSGAYAFVFNYIWMEIVVFALEGITYKGLLHRWEKGTKKRYPWAYALTANILSFAAGMIIAVKVPGIF